MSAPLRLQWAAVHQGSPCFWGLPSFLLSSCQLFSWVSQAAECVYEGCPELPTPSSSFSPLAWEHQRPVLWVEICVLERQPKRGAAWNTAHMLGTTQAVELVAVVEIVIINNNNSIPWKWLTI